MLRELKILAGIAALLTLTFFSLTEWAVTNQTSVEEASRASDARMRDARAELAAALKPSLAPTQPRVREAAGGTREQERRVAPAPVPMQQAAPAPQPVPAQQPSSAKASIPALPAAPAPARPAVVALSRPAAERVAALPQQVVRPAVAIHVPDPAKIRFDAKSFGVNPMAVPLAQAPPLKSLAPIMASLPERDEVAAPSNPAPIAGAVPEPRRIVAVAHPGRVVGPDSTLAPDRAALAALGLRFEAWSLGVNLSNPPILQSAETARAPSVAQTVHQAPPDDTVGATPSPARFAPATASQPMSASPSLPRPRLHIEALTSGINPSLLSRRTGVALRSPNLDVPVRLTVGPRPAPVTLRVDKWTLGVNGTALPAREPEPSPVVATAPIPSPPKPVSRPLAAAAPAVPPPAPVSRPVVAAAPALVAPAPVAAPKVAPLGSDPGVFSVIPWPAEESPAEEMSVSDEIVPTPPSAPSEATTSAQPAADEVAAADDVTASTQAQEETAPTSLSPSGEKVVLDQPKTKTGGRWTGCTKFKSYSARTETYRGLDGLLHECKAN
jgi:hypothetical protein